MSYSINCVWPMRYVCDFCTEFISLKKTAVCAIEKLSNYLCFLFALLRNKKLSIESVLNMYRGKI